MNTDQNILEKQQEERHMIEAAKANPTDFGPLYEKYFESIYRFAYQRLDDKDLAYDITTEVFVKGLKNINSYEYRGLPFSSWLYRIARNELNMLWRKNRSNRTVNLNDSDVYEMIEEIDHKKDEAVFEKMIDSLNEIGEEELQIIEMRFFEKRSFREIGEIMEITENNAKVRCYRILDKMKRIINEKRDEQH